MKILQQKKQEYVDAINFQVEQVFGSLNKLTPIEQVMLMKLSLVVYEIGNLNYKIYIQEKISKYTVDFLFVYDPIENKKKSKKIIIECDGHDFHEKTKEQAAHDKERDRFFVKNGYYVLRYTGSQIMNDKIEILCDLLQLILGKKYKDAY